jgi:hypothetical protein
MTLTLSRLPLAAPADIIAGAASLFIRQSPALPQVQAAS